MVESRHVSHLVTYQRYQGFPGKELILCPALHKDTM